MLNILGRFGKANLGTAVNQYNIIKNATIMYIHTGSKHNLGNLHKCDILYFIAQ